MGETRKGYKHGFSLSPMVAYPQDHSAGTSNIANATIRWTSFFYLIKVNDSVIL
jgi:hypothetical protein